MNTKNDRAEFLDLLNRFNVFQEIESLGKIENYFLPKIESFSAKIDEL